MLIPQVWVDLAEHDLAVTLPDAHHVILTGPSGERKYLLRILTRPPGPAQVAKAASDASGAQLPGLLIAPKASPAAQHAALRAGVSLLLAPDSIGQLTRGHLITPTGGLLTLHETTAATARRGRRPWATIAIATYLLEGNASTQDALAGRAGVSQARTSQVLRALQRWVQRTDRGWTATDTAGLTRWLAEQPPPGRTATTWLGLDDPAPTATRVAAWLTARHVGYAISADVAADLLAPWARPTRGLVYVEQALDLTPLGLTPAPPGAATLELVVPDDPYVLRDARLLPSDLVIAHPWRVWADTAARGNADAAEALRAHLLGVRTT
ncbi:MAG: hypothetical protein HHJ11_14340 [Phycicoccus sp.]|nr:hypothetical protein [Phycicoccus sp.]